MVIEDLEMTEKQATTENEPDFEKALERLQLVVRQLESGELSLEQALKSFEEGVRLTRVCQERLTAAEQKVELLLKASAAGVETETFRG